MLHYTAMADAQAACERLCDPEFEVSAHYLIARDGEVIQMVDEGQRAWHAGAGAWGAVSDVNSRSIGIELDNPGDRAFAAPQMAALHNLLGDILHRHAIAPERVIGHSDMAPGRKIDPGPHFDWKGLAAAGLSVWPDASGTIAPDPTRFRTDLRRFGYPDVDDALLLQAFHLRFRPSGTELSAADMAMARDLARRFPVDRTATTA